MKRSFLEKLGLEENAITKILEQTGEEPEDPSQSEADPVKDPEITDGKDPTVIIRTDPPAGMVNVNKSEYDKAMEELKNFRMSQMTEVEKAAEQMKEAQKLVEEYNRKIALEEAKGILISAGMTQEECEPLLNQIVTGDKEKSVALATNIASAVAVQRTAAEQRAKQKILQDTPDVPGGSNSPVEDSLGMKFAKAYGEKFI